MSVDKQTDGFDVLIEVILILMIFLSPLTLGAISPWARSVLFFAALVLAALWIMQAMWRGECRIARTSAWLFIAAFFLLVSIQRIPLPPGVLEWVSPGTSSAYGNILPDYPISQEARTLSLSPYATGNEILRLATLAIVFFIAANSIRRRWQVLGIVVTVVAIGSVEALYGLVEQLSGNKHIFWIPRQFNLAAVTGTFHNKNHFAGLLEMAIPVTLGLFFAMKRRLPRKESQEPSGPAARARILDLLSSSESHRRLAVGLLFVLMLLVVFLSLSRAGILCTIVGLIGFAAVLGMTAGFRRHTIALFLIVAGILAVANCIGMELVVFGLEDAVSGRSTSWTDRLDIMKSALSFLDDYPLIGTGLGTFSEVFPHYQSARFGDRFVDYLHNDWLQLFFETGLVGGLIVLTGLFFFLSSALRLALNRKDAFYKWISTGAILAVSSMLLHSFFDYNLSKITSNGILFSVLLGLSFSAARIHDTRRGSLPQVGHLAVRVRPVPIRVAVIVVVFAVVACAPFRISKAVESNFLFNAHLASSANHDDYFFLPLSEKDWGGEDLLERARALDPDNHRIAYASACRFVYEANELVQHQAAESARDILGRDIEQKDPEGFRQIVSMLQMNLKSRLMPQRAPLLTKAKDLLLQAVEVAPTIAHYHLGLADVLAELEPASAQSVHEAETALWLAPNKPANRFDVGRVFLNDLLSTPSDGFDEERYERIRDCFRGAIYANPEYASRIYSLVSSVFGGGARLIEFTPQTIRAYEGLFRVFQEGEDWHNALACLNAIEALSGADTTLPASMVHPAIGFSDGKPVGDLQRHLEGATGFDYRSPLDVSFSVAGRRCAAINIIGRWDEREPTVSRYRDLLRRSLRENVREADRLAQSRRVDESIEIYLNILQQDWSSPEVLLKAAEVSSAPQIGRNLQGRSGPIDHLYRLVINNAHLSQGQAKKALEILEELPRRDPSMQLVADFIGGAVRIAGGTPSAGVDILTALEGETSVLESWHQKHLLWYHLGLGHEAQNRRNDAIRAYRRVLELLPGHRPALLRLAALGEDVTAALAAMEPEEPCNIDFGGKIRLLGYGLHREMVPVRFGDREASENAWFMTLSWQFNDHLYRDYHPIVHFCDDQGRILFQADHHIMSGGKPYPMDFPRCGEVVVETVRLSHDPTRARTLRIGIWSGNPPESLANHILTDFGSTTFFTRLGSDTDQAML